MSFKEQTEQIVERGKALAEEGKQRHITILTREGNQLLETNVTVVVAVALVLLVTGLLSWPLILIAAIVAYWKGLKVEYSTNQVQEA